MADNGYVYVLINPSMEGLIKVGKTTREPKERAEELSKATGVPTPFIVAYEMYVNDCTRAEEFVHTYLGTKGYEVSMDDREVFNAPLKEAIDAILEYKQEIDSIEKANESDLHQENCIASSTPKSNLIGYTNAGKSTLSNTLNENTIDIKEDYCKELKSPQNPNEHQQKQSVRKHIKMLIFIAIGIFVAYALFDEYVLYPKRIQESYPTGYNSAIKILSKDRGDISYKAADTACIDLVHFSESFRKNHPENENIVTDPAYKDAEILYNYASAIRDTKDPKDSLSVRQHMALHYLEKIPDDYDGTLAEKIQAMKKEARAIKNTEKAKEILAEMQVNIGDSESKVLKIFGKPQRKNRTAVGNAVHEQWVYGNGFYVYLENGIVTSWQDRQ